MSGHPPPPGASPRHAAPPSRAAATGDVTARAQAARPGAPGTGPVGLGATRPAPAGTGRVDGGHAGPEYRIEELAHRSGATVRTIRAYQDRGLLPRPERRGRVNVYGEAHLDRLRQITELLDRGYTLASIKELLEAWDAGRGLGGVLGFVAEVGGPWGSEETVPVTRTELIELFGGVHHEDAVREAVELGVLEPVPGRRDEYLVTSPAELAVAGELHAAGVPLPAVSAELRELRGQVEQIAGRFMEFTAEHLFQGFLDHPPSDAEAAEAATLVRRLRPLAQRTVEAELARAMRHQATSLVRRRLAEMSADAAGAPPEAAAEDLAGDPRGAGGRTVTGSGGSRSATDVSGPGHGRAGAGPESAGGRKEVPAGRTGAGGGGVQPVPLPAGTVEAVRALVGADATAEFIAAAADREVRARTMDALAARHHRA